MTNIDISKVRTTRGGDDVRGLRYESDSANDKYPISGLRYHDGQWVMDAWATDGLYMRDGLARDADLIESPADRSQSCPHPTTSPDGVCDACRGVAVEPEAITRYELVRYGSDAYMGPESDGSWVAYADHVAALSHAGALARDAERKDDCEGVLDIIDTGGYVLDDDTIRALRQHFGSTLTDPARGDGAAPWPEPLNIPDTPETRRHQREQLECLSGPLVQMDMNDE